MKNRIKKFLADVLPPRPAPVVFEFTGLQSQLSELNTTLFEILTIKRKKERHEIESRGY